MTMFEPGGEIYEQQKEFEAREARRERISALPWALGPDTTEPMTEVIPLAQPVKVRFIHAAGDFEAAESDPHFDKEMNTVPSVGQRVHFPDWFYEYGAEVKEVHLMFGDDSPADVVVVVES